LGPTTRRFFKQECWEASLIRFLSKDLLSGLMFIVFGTVALYFGQKLALGTPVRMGPGYVPRMLSFILLSLGSIIVLVTLFRAADRAERERYWIPVAGLIVAVFAFSMIPWGANFIADNILGPANQAAFKTMTIPFMVSTLLVIAVVILMVLVTFFGRPASTHKAIALLALEHQAPLLVGIGRRLHEPLHYELGLWAVTDSKTHPPEAAGVRELTQWYTSQFEDMIRQTPEQYWWLHRRWKDNRPAKRRAKAA